MAEEELKNSKIEDISISKTSLSKSKDVNYTLLLNKDARYDWRPIQIVHPIVYVDLVNYMCEHWNEIIEKFKSFEKNEKIKCISIPLESISKKNNDKEEIKWEIADLIYHTLVLMNITDVTLSDIKQVLYERHIEKKGTDNE